MIVKQQQSTTLLHPLSFAWPVHPPDRVDICLTSPNPLFPTAVFTQAAIKWPLRHRGAVIPAVIDVVSLSSASLGPGKWLALLGSARVAECQSMLGDFVFFKLSANFSGRISQIREECVSRREIENFTKIRENPGKSGSVGNPAKVSCSFSVSTQLISWS